MNCEDIRKQIDAYPETGFAGWSDEAVRTHCDSCAECADAVKAHLAYIAEIENHFDELRKTGGGMKDAVLARIKIGEAAGKPKASVKPRRFNWALVASVAAMLVLAVGLVLPSLFSFRENANTLKNSKDAEEGSSIGYCITKSEEKPKKQSVGPSGEALNGRYTLKELESRQKEYIAGKIRELNLALTKIRHAEIDPLVTEAEKGLINFGDPDMRKKAAAAFAKLREKYPDMFHENYGVNPFIDTDEGESRFSTFAVDVDTASYTLARNYLNRGTMPPKAAIRVEEFINYFKHLYPSQKDEDGVFRVFASSAPSRFDDGSGYQLLRIGIKGKDVDVKNRKPASLTFVIDVSGSMEGSRLELVKRSLAILVNQMNESDQIGIITYGSTASVYMPPAFATGDNKPGILSSIFSLRTSGVTDAEAGLRLGYQTADKFFIRDGINRVILCSDGVANSGMTEASAIWKRIEDYAKKGIFLTTVGFGMGNYNDVLMEKLADNGDGNYAYVDNIKEARRIFEKEMMGTLLVIAKDVKIQVEFNPETVRKYRLIGYENRWMAKEDFRDDKKDAGEIGSGHEVTALYEVRLQPAKNGKDKIATVRIRHKKPGEVRAEENTQVFTRENIASEWGKADFRLRWDACVAEFAEILRGSYWAKKGSLKAVREEAETLRTLYFDNREDINEFIELVKKAEALQSQNE